MTNSRLVLQHLFDGSLLSRADLARLTGLTAATVSALIAELEETGLVAEVGTRRDESQVGKPPTMLAVRPESRNVISLDLSDPSVFRGAVVDLGGKIVASVDVPNPGTPGTHTLDAIDSLVGLAMGRAQSEILGVGIGTPGVVDSDGAVVDATSFGWHHIGLRQHVEDAVGYPAYVINDANAAAIAEYSRGGHDSLNLAVIKIGSGVGAGFVLDGRLFEGAHAGAGEIGHLVVDPDGPPCACGHSGCLETFVASSHLERALAQPGADAVAIRRAAANRLGVALAAVVAILDLDHVLISGSRRLLGEDFCDLAAESLRARCRESVAGSVNVGYTSLGEDVLLLGAASMVISHELGVS
ncbi:MAG: ROK family transcriptional regulator [Acidimicrobiales bacterium]